MPSQRFQENASFVMAMLATISNVVLWVALVYFIHAMAGFTGTATDAIKRHDKAFYRIWEDPWESAPVAETKGPPYRRPVPAVAPVAVVAEPMPNGTPEPPLGPQAAAPVATPAVPAQKKK